MLKEIEYPSYENGGVQRVSWGAVFAGAVTSLSVMLTLVSLCLGIGLVAAPAAGTVGGAAMGLGIGGGIALLACGVVSYYTGGWVAGRFTSIARVSESVLHGFVSWGTATLLFAFLSASAALGAFGAASGVMGGAIGMRGDAGAVRPGVADEIATEGARDASRAAGAAGLFGFLMLACNAAASCYGARNGTRLLKPVPATAERRERLHA